MKFEEIDISKSLSLKRKKQMIAMVHIMILVVFITSDFSLQREGFFFRFGLTTVFIILTYLLNIWYLIPKIFYKGFYGRYFAFLFILFIGYSGLEYTIALNRSWDAEINLLKTEPGEIQEGFFGKSPDNTRLQRLHLPYPHPDSIKNLPRNSLRQFSSRPSRNFERTGFPLFVIIPFFFRYFTIMCLGTLIQLILVFELERTKNIEMERAKVLNELNILKNQLNPHFLFNALNNIYSLARKKSDHTTPAILTLSEMLRYLLYETTSNKSTLKSELSFIQNYINLEKLKFSESNAPNINFTVSIYTPDYPVEPLLFMTLIENAFKHGVSFLSKSFILISLEENENEIKLSVINSNPKKDKTNSEKQSGGLGIHHLQKRMELLYPGKYSFKHINEVDIFKSFLTIKK